MEFLNPLIHQRIDLLNEADNLDEIEDVVFCLNVSNEVIQNLDIFLVPYLGLLNTSDKPLASKMALNKLIDKSFFKENDIDIKDKNYIVFFSFDIESLADKCYIMEHGKSEIYQIAHNLRGEVVNEFIPCSDDETNRSKNEPKESKYFLFFDTETTGKPKDFNASENELDNWPRIVQLAYILIDNNFQIISKNNYTIKPDGFIIPKESTEIHRISHEKALNEGIDLNYVLLDFNKIMNSADYLVAHNLEFDFKVLSAEFIRKNITHQMRNKKTICTMKSTTNYCAIKNTYGYKWPTLQELHFKLFNEKFINAHNALEDVLITYKCFVELYKKNIITYN
jgi:DNA polymerase-3 subunit epsilon